MFVSLSLLDYLHLLHRAFLQDSELCHFFCLISALMLSPGFSTLVGFPQLVVFFQAIREYFHFKITVRALILLRRFENVFNLLQDQEI